MGIFDTFVASMNRVYESRARLAEQRSTIAGIRADFNTQKVNPKTFSKISDNSIKRDVYINQNNNSKQTKLPYKKAKTIEEAVNYAKSAFGLKVNDIDDLELLNQINYTLKKANNNSSGRTVFMDEIEFADLTPTDSKLNGVCPAQLQMHHRVINGKDTATKTVLQLNRDLFKNPDKYVRRFLDLYEADGQLTKDKNGRDAIELICGYRYADSLSRYYRLYKQGKLTPKAKVDFQSMLCKAREEENLILERRSGLNKIFKEHLNKDTSALPDAAFKPAARRLLLELKHKKGMIIAPHCGSVKMHSAAGVDGYILHELGHRQHLEAVGIEEIINNRKNHARFDGNKEEFDTALLVSKYATENANEAVADIYAGIHSNDKYPNSVYSLLGKYGRFVAR